MTDRIKATWPFLFLAALAFAMLQPVRVAMGLSEPLAELKTTTVACSGTIAEISPAGAASMVIDNHASATAVYVGGSDVTTSTGSKICSACTSGELFPFDGKRAWCITGGGAVTVRVQYAKK